MNIHEYAKVVQLQELASFTGFKISLASELFRIYPDHTFWKGFSKGAFYLAASVEEALGFIRGFSDAHIAIKYGKADAVYKKTTKKRVRKGKKKSL